MTTRDLPVELARDLLSWQDGELDEAAAARLHGALEADPRLLAEARAWIDGQMLLYRAFHPLDPAEEAARCLRLARLRRASGRRQAISRIVRSRRPRRRQGPPLAFAWIGLAAAAALVLVLVRPGTTAPASGPGPAAGPSPGPVLAWWQAGSGPEQALRGGERLDLKAGEGRMRFADGSRIAVAGPSAFTLSAAPGHGLRIATGRFRVVAAPQAATRPLRLEGPLGGAQVLGTRFLVDADAARMRIAVEEGRVAVDERGPGRWALSAGQEITLGPTPVQVSAPFARDPAWRILGGEHLSWAGDAGEVRVALATEWRGTALWYDRPLPAGTPVRLECEVLLPAAETGRRQFLSLGVTPDPAAHEVGDLEFEPIIHRRLQVDRGEASFGYRFSADDADRRAVPLGPIPTGRWVALAFEVRDGRIHASLDGAPLGSSAPLDLPDRPLHIGLRASGRLQGAPAGGLRIGLRRLRVIWP